MLRFLLVFLVATSLVGCTSLRAIERPVSSIPSELEAGDRVRIETLSGKTYELLVSSLSESALVGKADDGKSWKVPYRQIRSIRVEEPSAAKTAGLSAFILLAIVAGMVIVGAQALGDAIEDRFDR